MAAYVEERNRGTVVIERFRDTAGREISCVDITTQPAARHSERRGRPLLLTPPADNPFAQTRARPNQGHAQATSRSNARSGPLLHTCPPGSVPIPLINMEVLNRYETLDAYHQQRESIASPQLAASPNYYHAVGEYVDLFGRGLKGMGGVFNVWNPATSMQNHSIAQLWIVAHKGTTREESVEFGLVKMPHHYSSENPHLFVYRASDHHDFVCWVNDPFYDQSECGFVQVSSSYYPNIKLANVSTYSGPQVELQLYSFRDQLGNWWVGAGGELMGYFPYWLFTSDGLRQDATVIAAGGEVYTGYPSERPSTDMGSGAFPAEGFGRAAYIRNLEISNDGQTLADFFVYRQGITHPGCYDAIFDSSAIWGTHVYYGGAGAEAPACN